MGARRKNVTEEEEEQYLEHSMLWFKQINETIVRSSCFQSFLDQQFKIYYKNQQI